MCPRGRNERSCGMNDAHARANPALPFSVPGSGVGHFHLHAITTTLIELDAIWPPPHPADPERVEVFAAAMRDGVAFPPIRVVEHLSDHGRRAPCRRPPPRRIHRHTGRRAAGVW